MNIIETITFLTLTVLFTKGSWEIIKIGARVSSDGVDINSPEQIIGGAMITIFGCIVGLSPIIVLTRLHQ